MDLLRYLNHTLRLFRKLFLTKLKRIRIWNITNYIESYLHIIYKTNFPKHFPSTHFRFHILCTFSDTEIIYSVTKVLLCTWSTKPCIYFLQCIVRHLLLRNFACKFRLRNVSKQNDSCHHRIQAWCTVHCEIGGTKGSWGSVSTRGA